MGESGAEDKPKRGRWSRRNLQRESEFKYFDYTAKRVMAAMLQMTKIDIEALRNAQRDA